MSSRLSHPPAMAPADPSPSPVPSLPHPVRPPPLGCTPRCQVLTHTPTHTHTCTPVHSSTILQWLTCACVHTHTHTLTHTHTHTHTRRSPQACLSLLSSPRKREDGHSLPSSRLSTQWCSSDINSRGSSGDPALSGLSAQGSAGPDPHRGSQGASQARGSRGQLPPGHGHSAGMGA